MASSPTTPCRPVEGVGLRERRCFSFDRVPSEATIRPARRPRAETEGALHVKSRRALISVTWNQPLPEGRAPSILPRVSCSSVEAGGRRSLELRCDRARRTTVRVDSRLAKAVVAFSLLTTASAFGGARAPRGLDAPKLNAAAIHTGGPFVGPPCEIDAARLLPTYPAPAAAAARLEAAARYLDRDSCVVVKAAVDFAARAHRSQRRKDGKPFVTHPIYVATILAELKMDASTVVAGLLHDTVEDTETTIEDLRVAFGDEVAKIVEGVTDEDDLPDPANQRELLLAMGREWRVALVKLADRLHNMRTLGAMPRHKRVKKATETLEVFVPLAAKLGASDVATELLDLSAKEVAPLGGLGGWLPGLASAIAKKRVPGKLDATLAALDVSLDAHAATWSAHAEATRPALSLHSSTASLYA